MCGIAGIISRNKSVDKNIVESALNKMLHRGMDDINIYYNGYNVAFGYIRLAIRGLDNTYSQPIVHNNYIAFGNGEVYNKNGKPINANQCDLLSIISDIPKKLTKIYDNYDADFALSIYDKNKNTFFLARDYFGVKPLFYSWIDNDTLAFASEIKGLLMLIERPEYDEKTIMDYLLFGYSLNEKTFYKNVFKLEPRTIFKWNLNNNKRAFFRADFNIKYRNSQLPIFDYFSIAVKNRLTSDRKISSHLSGGLDSSLIAYVTTNCLDYYTAFYAKDDFDNQNAGFIAEKLKLNQIKIKLNPNLKLKDIISILDCPVMSTGAFVPYQIAMNAYKNNVKVLLAGQGADELFLGYSRFLNIININDTNDLFQQLINSDLNLLCKLFKINIADVFNIYIKNIPETNCLLFAQKFYINNFLTSLLHIEDHTHMNFNIENRVPFLSLPMIKFIKQYGVCKDGNKMDIKYTHKILNSCAITNNNLNKKNNMNLKMNEYLKNIDYCIFFENKVFDNFDYEFFEKCIHKLDSLTKNELFVIWFVVNLNEWYNCFKFSKKIDLKGWIFNGLFVS